MFSQLMRKRCDHWNQRDIAVMKPVKTEKNPWLRFKREFVNAMSQPKECSREACVYSSSVVLCGTIS